MPVTTAGGGAMVVGLHHSEEFDINDYPPQVRPSPCPVMSLTLALAGAYSNIHGINGYPH